MNPTYNCRPEAEFFLADYLQRQPLRDYVASRAQAVKLDRAVTSRTLRKSMMGTLQAWFRQRQNIRQRLGLGDDFRAIIPVSNVDPDGGLATWFSALPLTGVQHSAFKLLLSRIANMVSIMSLRALATSDAGEQQKYQKSLRKLQDLFKNEKVSELRAGLRGCAEFAEAPPIEDAATMRTAATLGQHFANNLDGSRRKRAFAGFVQASEGRVARDGSWRNELFKVFKFWPTLAAEVNSACNDSRSFETLWALASDTGASKTTEYELVISANPFDMFYMSERCSWDTSSCFKWDGQMRTAPRALAADPNTCVVFMIKAGTTFPFTKEARCILYVPDVAEEGRGPLTRDYLGFPRVILGRPYGNVSGDIAAQMLREVQKRLTKSLGLTEGRWLTLNHQLGDGSANFTRYTGNRCQVYYDHAISGSCVYMPQTYRDTLIDYSKFPMIVTRHAVCLGCGGACTDGESDNDRYVTRGYFCAACLTAVSNEQSYMLSGVRPETKICGGCLKASAPSTLTDVGGVPICEACAKKSEHCGECFAPVSMIMERGKRTTCPVCNTSKPKRIDYAEATVRRGQDDFFHVPIQPYTTLGPAPAATAPAPPAATPSA